MATMAIEMEGVMRRAPTRLPVFLVVLAIALASIALGAHAVARHGGEADLVRQCIQQNGPMETWMNFDTGRLAQICQPKPGLFGIQIIKNGKEITSFLKNKLTRVDQVYQYLLNRGYKFIR